MCNMIESWNLLHGIRYIAIQISQGVIQLAINELEKPKGYVLEFLEDGSSDGLNRYFDSPNAGLQPARVLLGVFVQCGAANDDVNCSHSNNIKTLQLLRVVIIFLNLNQEHKSSLNPLEIEKEEEKLRCIPVLDPWVNWLRNRPYILWR